MRVLRAEAQGAVAIFGFAAFLRVAADFFGGICQYARLWRAAQEKINVNMKHAGGARTELMLV